MLGVDEWESYQTQLKECTLAGPGSARCFSELQFGLQLLAPSDRTEQTESSEVKLQEHLPSEGLHPPDFEFWNEQAHLHDEEVPVASGWRPHCGADIAEMECFFRSVKCSPGLWWWSCQEGFCDQSGFCLQTSSQENSNYAAIVESISGVSRYGVSFFLCLTFLLLTQMLSVQVRVHRCYPSHCKGSCQTPQRNTSSTTVLWPRPPAARLWSGSSSRTWQPFLMNRWAKPEAPVELNCGNHFPLVLLKAQLDINPLRGSFCGYLSIKSSRSLSI